MFLLISCLVILNGCTKENTSPAKITPIGTPGQNVVWMQNNAFVPNTLTVPENTTVMWTNKDYGPHTVTSTKNIFSSGTIANGATYTYLFTAPGSYSYYSSLDTTMTGTIVVLNTAQ